jgi:endonuclease/exonuclease/phosphatase family metal-dependent hydrolase
MNRAKPLALVALLFVITAELLRAVGPLLDALAGDFGIEIAAVLAIGLFLLPGLLLVVLRRASLPALVLLLLLVRVTAQFAPSLPVACAGAVLAIAALGLAVQRASDPVTTVCGVLAGGAIDLAIRSATMTWDPIWVGIWGLPMAALVVAALWFALDVEVPDEVNGRVWSVGAYLALWTTTLGNAGFLASQTGLGLQLCLLIMLAVIVVSMAIVRRGVPWPVAALSVLIGVSLAWLWTGPVAMAGLVIGQIGAALALACAISAPATNRGTWAYGLVWVLPVLLFQVHYDRPLPFDNRYLLIGVALLLALGAFGHQTMASAAVRSTTGRRVLQLIRPRTEASTPVRTGGPLQPTRPRADMSTPADTSGPLQPARSRVEASLRTGSGPMQLVRRRSEAGSVASRLILLTLLVPMIMLVTPTGATPAEPSRFSMRLMTWNIKYGRDDARGIANPRQIAAAIAEAKPDVVVLQEGSRGWTIGGGVDVAEFLSRELGMAYRWAPAADNQFGNLLLTNRELIDVEVGSLPYGQGPMQRSYLKATVRVNAASKIDLITTHLTHRKQNTPTRLAQIDTILSAKPMVLAGDLNFWPTWDESRSFTRAGYRSAQDITGHSAEWTSPTNKPTNRVDWIYGNSGVAFKDFAILTKVTASDHFPLIVTVTSA